MPLISKSKRFGFITVIITMVFGAVFNAGNAAAVQMGGAVQNGSAALNAGSSSAVNVSTLAGSSMLTGSTDATGTAARFGDLSGITTDGANLYLTDSSNHTIRKVVIATGVVTTLAGSAGTSGSINGTGTAALFNSPADITTDGANLYIADSGNHTLRKVVIATGVVTTLAGSAGTSGSTNGTGTAALFSNPTGLTTDGMHLYVADTNNHAIRKVAISSGVVTTLAGSAGTSGSTNGTGTAALFYMPHGITTDSTNLYITDSGNHTIRKVVIGTAVVTTLAGTAGTSGPTDATGTAALFDNPRGITMDGTSLFLSDQSGIAIRKVTLATSAVMNITGGCGAEGLTTDGTNLYVASTHCKTILKISNPGVWITAGNGQATANWGAVTGATKYNIDWVSADGAESGSALNIAGTSTVVTGLKNGTTYYFRMEAMNGVTVLGSTGFSDGAENGISNWIANVPGTWGTTLISSHTGSASFTDSPGVDYANNANTSLTIAAPLDLRSSVDPALTFWHKYDTEATYDFCLVEVSTDGGLGWTELARYSGTLATWTKVSLSLRAYAGLSSVSLRFRFTSDGNKTFDGWYVDDITLYGLSATPDAGVWTTKAPMTFQRDNAAAAVLDGKIYVMAGAPAGTSILDSMEAYDPATDTWTTKASLPAWSTPAVPAWGGVSIPSTYRYGPAAAVVNGLIYLLGGTKKVNGQDPIFPIAVYNPATNTWAATVPVTTATTALGTAGATLATIPTGRWGFDAVVVDGLIYAIGGAIQDPVASHYPPDGNIYYGKVEVYDPVANTWTTKASMPTPRWGMTVSVVNGLIYAIGGWGGWPELSVVEVYDPVTNTWASNAFTPMPTARDDFAFAVLNGIIYAIGGDLGIYSDTTNPPTGCCTRVVEAYDPIAKTWMTKAPMPTIRDDFDAVTVDGIIYALAGSRDGKAANGGYSVTTVEAYTSSPVSTPGGVTGALSGTQASINWNPVSGATLYNIYWSNKAGVSTTVNSTKITGVTAPYVHTLTASGNWYYYVVTAVTVAGESLPSNEVSVTLTSNTYTTLSATSQSFASTGGTGSVTVTGSGSWTATSSLSWVTITAGASGAGAGIVTFIVSANTTGATRTGNITLAGQTFVIVQSGSKPVSLVVTTPASQTYFDAIQTAYSSNLATSGCSIMLQGVTLTEPLLFNQDITLTLTGGYDSSFSSFGGTMTIVQGSLTISGGSVTVANLVIQ